MLRNATYKKGGNYWKHTEAFCSVGEAVTRKINRTFFVGNLTYFNFLHNYFLRSYPIFGDKCNKQFLKRVTPPYGLPSTRDVIMVTITK